MNASATSSEFELALPNEGIAIAPQQAAADLKRFHRWVIFVLLVHVVMLTGLITTNPRRLGDASGMDDAISVSLVSESELRGKATVADKAAGEPAPPPTSEAVKDPQDVPPAEQPTPEQKTPEQPTPAEPPEQQTEAVTPPPEPTPAEEPEAKPASEPVPEPTPKSESQSTQDAAQKAEAVPPLRESVMPNSPDAEADAEPTPQPKSPSKTAEKKTEPAEPPPPKPKPKQAETKPVPAKPKKTKTANLDLSMPRTMRAPPGSRGAGFERPAGITRSGENDDFARGVIRALQATMPQLRDTHGRVRVRILLNKNGNLVRTTVEMPSRVPGLDQSVVFATRQTSFPLPPYNANDADLVFIVTYIYE